MKMRTPAPSSCLIQILPLRLPAQPTVPIICQQAIIDMEKDKNIHGYYDMRKIGVNSGCNIPSYLLVRPSIQF